MVAWGLLLPTILKKFHYSRQKFPHSEKGVAKNYISIALTVSRMVLTDS